MCNSLLFSYLLLVKKKNCPQEMWRDGKEFKICIASLEFESGHAPLVKTWDSWGFTRSPRPTKCTFRE